MIKNIKEIKLHKIKKAKKKNETIFYWCRKGIKLVPKLTL
jgi:hypothetical protein